MAKSARQHLAEIATEARERQLLYPETKTVSSAANAAAAASGRQQPTAAPASSPKPKLSAKEHLAMVVEHVREQNKRYPYLKTVSSARDAQLQAAAAAAAAAAQHQAGATVPAPNEPEPSTNSGATNDSRSRISTLAQRSIAGAEV